jgi:uracil-DNA glycosylase
MDDQSRADSPPDTSFVPWLDARQRAMLAEMGVRVWAPRPSRSGPVAVTAPEVAASSAPAAPPAPIVEASPPVARANRTAPTVSPASDEASPAVPSPVALQALPHGLESMDLAALALAASECQACGLCQRRKNTVWGVGDSQADWMVVGDPPSEEEEAQGQPFVGPAGELLDNMLRAVGVSRERGAYVTSVTKCRPPSRAIPSAQELAQCSTYLARQVALVKPKVIIAMGRFALEVLTQSRDHLGKLRGRTHAFEGVPVIATYHPSALLRTQTDKAKAWADLCLAMTVTTHTAPQD